MSPDELRQFAQHAAGSPLYVHLVEVIASDDELMRVVNEMRHGPQPNVLFAGVQYLLMNEPDEDLARYYPNLNEEPAPIADVDNPFREFVLRRRTELIEIGRTRYTQTNETGRCSALLPAIWETGCARFHLVDLGTSAGLNLLIDRYHYRWDGIGWGPSSPVTLECDLRGRPPSPGPIEVLSRTGLDLNPVDPSDPDARSWLEALIWPEQEERRRRLRAAFELYQQAKVDLVPGDAAETLGRALRGLPGVDPIVVMHSFSLNQLTRDQQTAVEDTLVAVRESRPVWRASLELLDWGDEAPELTIDDGSGPRVIGRAQPHGEWLDLFQMPSEEEEPQARP